jgi:hypothetical protein
MRMSEINIIGTYSLNKYISGPLNSLRNMLFKPRQFDGRIKNWKKQIINA